MLILHKKIGYYKNFVVQNKTTPKNTTTLKKFPRKMWFRQGNNLTFKKILFYCTFPEEEKRRNKCNRDRKRQEHLITVNNRSICDGNC